MLCFVLYALEILIKQLTTKKKNQMNAWLNGQNFWCIKKKKNANNNFIKKWCPQQQLQNLMFSEKSSDQKTSLRPFWYQKKLLIAAEKV